MGTTRRRRRPTLTASDFATVTATLNGGIPGPADTTTSRREAGEADYRQQSRSIANRRSSSLPTLAWKLGQTSPSRMNADSASRMRFNVHAMEPAAPPSLVEEGLLVSMASADGVSRAVTSGA